MTAPPILTFIDGCLRDSVPKQTLSVLDEKFTSIRSSSIIDFTGIVWATDIQPAVFFPKCSQIPERREDQKRLIRVLIDSLRRYSASDSASRSADVSSSVLSCAELELLELYQRDGLYSNRENHVSQNIKGPIDWKRTINAMDPSLNKDGSLFYLETMKRGYQASDTQIRRIHATLVNRAIAAFDLLVDVKPCNEVAASQRSPVSDETALRLLQREISQQFSEKKIRLIKLLIAVLEQRLSGSRSEGSVFGTTRFEMVWEHMISSYLGDQKKNFRGLAIPAYVNGSGAISASAGNSARPDTILENDDRIAVIDAKYYDFSVSKPQWSDLVKQFFYAKTFKINFPKSRISNWFFMPGVDNNGAHQAVVINSNNHRLDDEFPPIAIQFKDPFEVMSHYADRRINHEDRLKSLAG